MSDYVYEFGASLSAYSLRVTEEVDLIDEGWFTEEELKGESEYEIQNLLNQSLQDFVWENVDSWVKRV